MAWYGLVPFVVILHGTVCFGMVDSELMVEHYCTVVAGFYGMVGWYEVVQYGAAW